MRSCHEAQKDVAAQSGADPGFLLGGGARWHPLPTYPPPISSGTKNPTKFPWTDSKSDFITEKIDVKFPTFSLFKVKFGGISPESGKKKNRKRPGERSEPRKILEYECSKPFFFIIFGLGPFTFYFHRFPLFFCPFFRVLSSSGLVLILLEDFGAPDMSQWYTHINPMTSAHRGVWRWARMGRIEYAPSLW